MSKQLLITGPLAREAAIRRVQEAPEGSIVSFRDADRTLDQNAAQWPILDAFAKQVQWPVNGEYQFLSADEWKDILTAAFKRETQPRIAAGLDGGMVILGQRTSKFSKKQFSEWLEFLNATAAHRGVNIGERS